MKNLYILHHQKSTDFKTKYLFKETDLPFPISPYAIGKYGGELYARMKRHQNINKKILCLRPFNTFGPYQSERAIIPEIIIKCLKGETIKTTEGLQTREFNYVDNIVDGFIASVDVSKFLIIQLILVQERKFQLETWLRLSII